MCLHIDIMNKSDLLHNILEEMVNTVKSYNIFVQ